MGLGQVRFEELNFFEASLGNGVVRVEFEGFGVSFVGLFDFAALKVGKAEPIVGINVVGLLVDKGKVESDSACPFLFESGFNGLFG